MKKIRRRQFIKDMGLFLSGSIIILIYPITSISSIDPKKNNFYKQSLVSTKRNIRYYGRRYRIEQKLKFIWKDKIKKEAKKYAIYYKQCSQL